jgi:hypothetical protein
VPEDPLGHQRTPTPLRASSIAVVLREFQRAAPPASWLHVGSKLASTAASEVSSNMHPVEPRHAPDHARNEPFSGGAATIVMEVPGENAAMHIPGQSMPGGSESTRPGPWTCTATVSEPGGAGGPGCPQAADRNAAAATILLTLAPSLPIIVSGSTLDEKLLRNLPMQVANARKARQRFNRANVPFTRV